jgi:hypothetical protein
MFPVSVVLPSVCTGYWGQHSNCMIHEAIYIHRCSVAAQPSSMTMVGGIWYDCSVSGLYIVWYPKIKQCFGNRICPRPQMTCAMATAWTREKKLFAIPQSVWIFSKMVTNSFFAYAEAVTQYSDWRTDWTTEGSVFDSCKENSSCDGPVTPPEESYRMWYVWVWSLNLNSEKT